MLGRTPSCEVTEPKELSSLELRAIERGRSEIMRNYGLSFFSLEAIGISLGLLRFTQDAHRLGL